MSNPPQDDPSEPTLQPSKAQAAFERLAPRLDALRPDQLRHPNQNLSKAAIKALGVAQGVAQRGLREDFVGLPPRFWDIQHLDDLEDLAWMSLHVYQRRATEDAIKTEAKLPQDLLQEARAMRASLLRVAEYHLEDPTALKVLQSIRAGSGHLDLASDLSRLADLYQEHAATLALDPKHYRPELASEARQLTVRLLGALSTPSTAGWAQRVSRAWTLLWGSYSEVLRAADFLYAHDPLKRALFFSLTGDL
jgi:hypothetical protein